MRDVEISNIALDGMNRAASALDKTATRIARMPLSAEAPPADSVDLSQDMVDLLAARRSFEANVKTARTGDELTRTLLDMLRGH